MTSDRRLALEQATVVLGGLGAALMCGLLIGRGAWWVPAAGAIVAALVATGMRGGKPVLVLVTAAALVQLPLSALGPVPDVQLAEIVVPLLALGWLLQSTGRRARAGTIRVSPRLVHIAVGAYAAVLATNFVRSRYLLETTAAVNRPFFAFAVALGAYALVYLALTSGRVRFEFLFRLLFWLAIAMSIFGIVAVVANIPLNLGNQAFSVAGYKETSAVRVGFLDVFGMVGLALVVTRPGRFRFASGALFAGALFASGGRSAVLGIILALALYLLVANRWAPLVVTVAIAALVIPLAVPRLEQQSQFQRLTSIGPQVRQTNERAFYYDASLRAFSHHPLTGTGIGAAAPVYARDPDVATFYEQQLQYGGHATYHSLLKNFGLLGFVPFAVALLGAIVGLGRLVARGSPIAGVFFVLLVAQVIALYASGNGSDPFFFFALGGGSAAIALGGRSRAPAAASSTSS